METPHILPLLWFHGENFQVIETVIRQMHSAGLRGFVVESRPFDGYMGNFWWETLEFVFSLAEKLEMQAMLFDDSHFPSGYADGKIAAEHPEFLRHLLESVSIRLDHQGGKFDFDTSAYLEDGDKFAVKVFILPMIDENIFDADKTAELPIGKSSTALPAGKYTVQLWKVTRNGGEKHTRNYINMLSKPAVRCYIDTVYRPHTERLKRFIGKSFIGFFSDEPRLSNISGYHALPGEIPMNLPYSETLPLDELPFVTLKSSSAERDRQAKVRFMDAVSREYSESFPQQIGEFCKENGLLYIGHIVEDDGAHTRLGYSNGHFFRSMQGQSWAGVDTVLGQNRPDHTEGVLQSTFGKYNCEFFHYALMKLGSSCGELNGTPSFAEVFGAYGWSEDLAMMKWHTDLAVVRGINRLLPHAFTLKEFPDPDCPPHFYARGNNPQWKYFPSWLKYAQTLCELHSDGKAVIPAAVLYHAETEWQKSDCIKCETIIAILCRHQIDSRIVSFDHLKDATVENGTLTIKDADIKLLFAADRELLPDSEKETLDRLSKEGLDIVYVDENNLADLAEIAAARKLQGLEVDTYSPSLVYRHYRKNGSESYFLVNESWQTPVCTKLNTPLDGNWQQIDLISGKRCKFTGNIELAPGESALLIPDDGTTVPAKAVCRGRKTRLKLPTAVPEKDFYGTISTSVQITAEKSDMRIEFPELRSGAVVEISIDGKTGGHCFAPPFRFDLADLSIGKTLDVQFSFTTTPAPAFRNERFDLDAPFPDDFWDIYVEIS